MKFSCDRCKTRYTIADDRVRGKILKIRCKNCANVITVREGGADAAEPHSAAPARAATAAPVAAMSEALARAATTAPPPTALDDEWYVSIAGEQHGPFDLAAAREWITAQPADAELHCWCEGFDDWLPVEKVSHFRGLRAEPTPEPRPELEPEPEPEPLFASTMAAIEARVAAAGQTAASARPLALPTPRPTHGRPATASPGRPPTPVPTPPVRTPAPAVRAAAVAPRVDARPDLFADAGPERSPATPDTSDYTQPLADTDLESGDDLSIGEVSRVVRIADLAKQAEARADAKTRAATASHAAIGRGTGAVPRIDPSVLMPAPASPEMARIAEAAAAEPLVAPGPARRSPVPFLIVGGFALLAVLVVVLVVTNQDETDDTNTGYYERDNLEDLGKHVDPVTGRVVDGPAPGTSVGTAGSAGSAGSGKVVIRRPGSGGGNGTGGSSGQGTGSSGTATSPVGTDFSGTRELTTDDVLNMYQRRTFGVQRCYAQATKQTFLDVDSVKVSISVDRSGAVTKVGLSSQEDQTLGKCLMSSIRQWKFEPNRDGINTEFVMKFQK